MTRSRYRFGDEHYPHFMTSTVVAWLPVFSYPEFAKVILDSWRFLQSQRDIDILAWVLMENHLHWIGVGPNLSKRVGEFKSFTAITILKLMEQKGTKTLLQELSYYKLRHKTDQQHQLWQEGSHPVIIETEAMMWQKIEYIHNNPLRRGFVDDSVACDIRALAATQVKSDSWTRLSIGVDFVRVQGVARCMEEAEPPRQCVPRRSLGTRSHEEAEPPRQCVPRRSLGTSSVPFMTTFSYSMVRRRSPASPMRWLRR